MNADAAAVLRDAHDWGLCVTRLSKRWRVTNPYWPESAPVFIPPNPSTGNRSVANIAAKTRWLVFGWPIPDMVATAEQAGITLECSGRRLTVTAPDESAGLARMLKAREHEVAAFYARRTTPAPAAPGGR